MPPPDAHPTPASRTGGGLVLPAARLGLLGAAGAAVVAVVLAVLFWLPDAGATGHPGGAVRAGLLAFLAAHHGGVTVGGVPVGFVPLGTTMVLALVVWRAASGLTELAPPGVRPARWPLRLVGGFAAGHLVGAGVALGFARWGTSGAGMVRTVLAAALFPALVAAAALLRDDEVRAAVALTTPGGVRRLLAPAVRPAAAAALGYLALGALLTAASLVTHAGRVEALSRATGGGVAGLPVLLLGLLSAPNAAVAAAAYAAGPGFAVGSAVGPFGATHGVLPAVPVLGAVPAGRAPVWAVVLIAAGIVGVGVTTGLLTRWCVGGGLAAEVRTVAVAAAGAGAVMAVLGWLAGGAVGQGRLRAVGASAWQLGTAVAVETLLIGVLTVAVAALVPASVGNRVRGLVRRPRRARLRAAEDAQVELDLDVPAPEADDEDASPEQLPAAG